MLKPKTLGVLSLAPPFAALIAFLAFFAFVAAFTASSVGYWLPLVVMIVAVLVIVATVIVFAVDAVRRPQLDSRAVWILLIVCLWPIGPFIYWLVPVREQARVSANAP